MKTVVSTLMLALTLLAMTGGVGSAQNYNAGFEATQIGDFETALREWRPLAEQGNVSAQYNLGYMYGKGMGVTQDFAKSAKWYRKSAEQGFAAAQYELGLIYKNTGERNLRLKVEKIQNSAVDRQWTMEDTEALKLAHNGHRIDGIEAQKLFKLAADQGHPKAQYELGLRYKVQNKSKEGLELFRLAAKQGYAGAQYEIFKYHLKKRNDTEASKFLDLAVNQEHPESLYILSIEDSNKDPIRSKKLLHRSAQLGHLPAVNNLCKRSISNPIDALQWCMRGADLGDNESQYRLALMYEEGKILKQDLGKATYWNRQAAASHHQGATLKIGYAYEKGLGVVPDEQKATFWYKKAYRGSYPNSETKRKAALRLSVMMLEGRGIPRNDELLAEYLSSARTPQSHELLVELRKQQREKLALSESKERRNSPSILAILGGLIVADIMLNLSGNHPANSISKSNDAVKRNYERWDTERQQRLNSTYNHAAALVYLP